MVCFFCPWENSGRIPRIFRLCHLWRGIDTPSEFVRLMASEKMSNRSKKGSVEASRRLLCVGNPPQKWSQPEPISVFPLMLQRISFGFAKDSLWIAMDFLWFCNKSKMGQISSRACLHRGTGREASTWTSLDLLGMFCDAIDLINTLGGSISRHRWHAWNWISNLDEFSQGQKSHTISF